MDSKKESKKTEKQLYHSPNLTTYGDISELTKTASGSGRQDGTGNYGTARYST